MKKWFVFMIGACLSLVMTHADTYSYLTFRQADGTLVSVASSSLSMTFVDGKLVATNGSESLKMTVADLTSMFFSETNETTGIDETTITNADGEVQVFSLQGVSLGKFDTLESLKQKLPAGIYVVKTVKNANGKISKIVVK